MIGYDMMLRYMRDIGFLNEEECADESKRAWKIMVANSVEQAADLREERPGRMFTTAIGEMLATQAVRVRDLVNPGAGVPKDMIGYADGMFYYLMPNSAYRAVVQLYADQGSAFPLTQKMLYKQLREDGVLALDPRGLATRVKQIDGRNQRLLWIPRVEIDGKPEIREQQRMAFVKSGDAGFEEVDEPTPFDEHE